MQVKTLYASYLVMVSTVQVYELGIELHDCTFEESSVE